MNILLIEDNYYESRLFESMLSEHDLNVADSGESAIQLMDCDPDLILLDVNQKESDRYDACQLIRGQSNTKNTPIICISEYSGLEDRIKAFDMGGN